jgi:hypothetical protein
LNDLYFRPANETRQRDRISEEKHHVCHLAARFRTNLR